MSWPLRSKDGRGGTQGCPFSLRFLDVSKGVDLRGLPEPERVQRELEALALERGWVLVTMVTLGIGVRDEAGAPDRA